MPGDGKTKIESKHTEGDVLLENIVNTKLDNQGGNLLFFVGHSMVEPNDRMNHDIKV